MAEILPINNTELFGHERETASLLRDVGAGKLAHGILITGSRGIGKATLAHRLARMLLSESEDMLLDAEHPVFRRIVAGSHSDLLVIEQEYDEKKEELAREISVEQARSISDFLSLTPGEGKWRVVIIDSIDALNVSAANAILKILEEPPPQAVLLLVSHNPGRLLPTIRSRCRLLKLAPVSQAEFTKILRHIAPDTDYEMMQSLYILSAGSPGQALEMKEQGALEWYRQLLDMTSALPAIDARALHAFADQFAARQVNAKWQLFTELMLTLLERAAKQSSGMNVEEIFAGENEMLMRLSLQHSAGIWATKWQQCAEQFSLAQARHLDYKQVVITFVHSMSYKEGFQLGNAAA